MCQCRQNSARRSHEVREAEVHVQLDAHQQRRARARCRSSPRSRRRSERRTRTRRAGLRARRAGPLPLKTASATCARLSATNIFLKKPHRISHSAVADLRPRECVRGCAICGSSAVGAQDRAGDQVRKIGDEQREVAQVPARLDVAPVDVDHVAHRDERVERDADRQDDVQRRVVGMQAERRAAASAGCRRRS